VKPHGENGVNDPVYRGNSLIFVPFGTDEKITAQMTPEQIANAKKRVVDFVPRKESEK